VLRVRQKGRVPATRRGKEIIPPFFGSDPVPCGRDTRGALEGHALCASSVEVPCGKVVTLAPRGRGASLLFKAVQAALWGRKREVWNGRKKKGVMQTSLPGETFPSRAIIERDLGRIERRTLKEELG